MPPHAPTRLFSSRLSPSFVRHCCAAPASVLHSSVGEFTSNGTPAPRPVLCACAGGFTRAPRAAGLGHVASAGESRRLCGSRTLCQLLLAVRLGTCRSWLFPRSAVRWELPLCPMAGKSRRELPPLLPSQQQRSLRAVSAARQRPAPGCRSGCGVSQGVNPGKTPFSRYTWRVRHCTRSAALALWVQKRNYCPFQARCERCSWPKVGGHRASGCAVTSPAEEG